MTMMERARAFGARIREQPRVTELQSRFDALQSRFDALRDMESWAEIDLRTMIGAGKRVRHLIKIYECTQSHEKALLKAPPNGDYWEEVEA